MLRPIKIVVRESLHSNLNEEAPHCNESNLSFNKVVSKMASNDRYEHRIDMTAPRLILFGHTVQRSTFK